MSAPLVTDAAAQPDTAGGWVPWPEEFARRYVAEGYWRGGPLGDRLRDWAARSGAATAVVAGPASCPVRLSYAELDQAADDLAAGLTQLGIAPGDRILVQLPNRAEFVTLLFAMLRLGVIPVLALPAHRRVEIEHLASLSGAVAYAVPDTHEGFDHRALARDIMATVPAVRHVLVAGDAGEFTGLDALAAAGAAARAEGRAAAPPAPDPAGVAVLLISGGTTGKPKLIPRTHWDYAYNAAASAELCGLTAEDTYLVALPAAHNFPLACPGILGAFGSGATVVMASSPSPEVAFDLIARERVTVTALVPALARIWVSAAEWERPDTASLRLLQVGGARLDAELARRIPTTLGAQVQQVFGMAEGLLNYTRLDEGDELAFTTQGRPLAPADEIRIVDRDGADVPPGEVGELWTRGPYTLRGYYRAAEHNATAFSPDGYYQSGDLVRQTPSGNLVVEGRIKDVINRGGENVSAGELEEHLLAHPAIAQAAVIAAADEQVGESVRAVVVLVPAATLTLKAVKAFLRERGLARFMLPDLLTVADALPLTAVGKIDKRELRRRIG
ncbi:MULTISPECIES: (2,3-dihydroxybenzoyl)adenylate synthase [unclassified Pseudofrankia]|uniref:(2,3-dihydroxybenzoyl)adenylate synthase n=1 Tax=unclassified Pseudofrankia TaxID=2994372 RepID=UPI0008DA2561|nr:MULTISPECIES: AMP-binding protein [unclassified Pseudofrankia]MDT3439498.1 AMP-binding protein [Pseudofrankia sp. BMG5.37]OHV48690.1 2,3-dihydroxybenzoate-AMP ligase [Pseudofrankia sp. BMG5.36]